jgi:hypothetical protein
MVGAAEFQLSGNYRACQATASIGSGPTSDTFIRRAHDRPKPTRRIFAESRTPLPHAGPSTQLGAARPRDVVSAAIHTSDGRCARAARTTPSQTSIQQTQKASPVARRHHHDLLGTFAKLFIGEEPCRHAISSGTPIFDPVRRSIVRTKSTAGVRVMSNLLRQRVSTVDTARCATPPPLADARPPPPQC